MMGTESQGTMLTVTNSEGSLKPVAVDNNVPAGTRLKWSAHQFYTGESFIFLRNLGLVIQVGSIVS